MFFCVAFTLRNESRRIISLRRPNDKEIDRYANEDCRPHPPQPEENEEIDRGLALDPDSRELTDEEFKRLKPFAVYEKSARKRGIESPHQASTRATHASPMREHPWRNPVDFRFRHHALQHAQSEREVLTGRIDFEPQVAAFALRMTHVDSERRMEQRAYAFSRCFTGNQPRQSKNPDALTAPESFIV
jgi:hypothetical protein